MDGTLLFLRRGHRGLRLLPQEAQLRPGESRVGRQSRQVLRQRRVSPLSHWGCDQRNVEVASSGRISGIRTPPSRDRLFVREVLPAQSARSSTLKTVRAWGVRQEKCIPVNVSMVDQETILPEDIVHPST